VLTCMKFIAFRTVDCFGVSNFGDVFFFALLSFHIFSLRREIVRIHIDCVTLSEILENTELHGNLFRSSGESGRIIL
jgi:hypothetical protein